MTTHEKLPMIDNRTPRIRKVDGHESWVIDAGYEYGWRLCGDGRWKAWSAVLSTDACAWPTRAAAIAFLHSLSASEQPQRSSHVITLDDGLERWDAASKWSYIHRDKIDAIYSAVLHSTICDPWDQESGCPRMIPGTAEKAVADFDAQHSSHIKRVNAALDLVRDLFGSPRVSKELADELQSVLQKVGNDSSGNAGASAVPDVSAVQEDDGDVADAAMIKPNWHRAQHEAARSIAAADRAVEAAGRSEAGSVEARIQAAVKDKPTEPGYYFCDPNFAFCDPYLLHWDGRRLCYLTPIGEPDGEANIKGFTNFRLLSNERK